MQNFEYELELTVLMVLWTCFASLVCVCGAIAYSLRDVLPLLEYKTLPVCGLLVATGKEGRETGITPTYCTNRP